MPTAQKSPFCRVPPAWRVPIGFVLGVAGGLLMEEFASPGTLAHVLPVMAPFGDVMVAMLKMVVYPIILFSLVMGAASLPLKQSGKVGGRVVAWYAVTSVFAALLGIAIALALNPSMDNPAAAAAAQAGEAQKMAQIVAGSTFASFFTGLFVNPFAALAAGNFLPIIVFALLFGVAARCLLDGGDAKATDAVNSLLAACDGAQRVSFKLIDWVILYFPFGVFALTFKNFAENGTKLFGPYLQILACVVTCVLEMIFVV